MGQQEIPTEYGTGAVWWDDQDPGNPGWVLRYHLEPPESEDALGRRHLDAPLDCDAGPDDTDAAVAAGLAELAAMGIGAGRRCNSHMAADVAGLPGGASSWRRRAGEWGATPDGHHDRRTPWWWETTVIAARAARPGRGTRTDLTKED